MTNVVPSLSRADPEPLPANVRSVQPGGGVCYEIELAWGRWRRWYLRHVRADYVRRMAQRRRGSTDGCPHEILDPRDLKYCRNRCDCTWTADDDPFAWRGRLPLARWGLAELQLIGYPLAAAAALLAWWGYWYLALLPGIMVGLVVYFFRDPARAIPTDQGAIVSPADGVVVEVTRVPDEPSLGGGPAVRIGVFLSIFNVHVNRAPCRARVIRLRYDPGRFLNALRPESAQVNERMTIELEQEAPPHRRMIVRQISGQIARRIVCELRPGEAVETGHKFGMIKLGSRTELTLPDDGHLQVMATRGQRIRAGCDVVARYRA